MPISKTEVFLIVTSTNEPSGKTSGLRWDEINSSGDLIQSWIWINNRWVSPIKNIIISPTATTGYFPLATNYKYLFKNINIWLRANGGLSSSAYARITTQILQNSTATLLSVETFNNQNANISLIKNQTINQLFVPSNNESIRFLIEKINSTAALDIGIDLSYQLVRR